MVSSVRNVAAEVLAPTVTPSRIVTMSMNAVCAVLASRSVTSDSRSRLPKNSMPSSGRPPGASSVVSRNPTIGNMIRTRLETGARSGMRMRRSSRVVSSRMIGGWMIGTSAM